MKEKLEQALEKCLEENGYVVRQVVIDGEILNSTIIQFNGALQIRAKK